MKPRLLYAAAALFASLAAADWVPVAIDRTVGASAPAAVAITAGAFPAETFTVYSGAELPTASAWTLLPTTNAAARVTTNLLTAAATLLRSVSPGAMETNGAVTLYAVTSGVEIALATFTNNAAPWTAQIWLSPNDVVKASATNCPAGVTLSAVTQLATDTFTNTHAMAGILRSVSAGTILPTNATVTLYVVTSGVEAATATFTNGSAAYTASPPLLYGTGGVGIALVPNGVTNAAAFTVSRHAVLAANRSISGLLRSVTPGPILPTNGAVALAAVTSGVTVALATFTNGAAAYAPATPLLLLDGDALLLTPSGGVTNPAPFEAVLQTPLVATIEPEAEPFAVKISSVRILAADALAPHADGTNHITLAYTPYGGTPETLATFTNGATLYTPAAALLLLRGDTLTATPHGLTNAVRLRAPAERYVQ